MLARAPTREPSLARASRSCTQRNSKTNWNGHERDARASNRTKKRDLIQRSLLNLIYFKNVISRLIISLNTQLYLFQLAPNVRKVLQLYLKN